MEKTPLLGPRSNLPVDLIDDVRKSPPKREVSAVQATGLPPVPMPPPPLSTRQVAVSDKFSVAQLTLPLPDFLRERPFFGHLLQTVVGRSDHQRKEIWDLAWRIQVSMGVAEHVAGNVCASLDDAQLESMCRLFCGEGATVLVTEAPGHCELIVLPLADTSLLHHLAELLVNFGSPVVAAKLLCGAMLTMRDTPERAAGLLKSYCQLLLKTRQQLPAPPMSLEGLIKAVLAHGPGCLLADEVYALKRQFELAAANEADPVKANAFTSVAELLAHAVV